MSQSEKLDSALFRETMSEDLVFLFDLFKRNSFELRIAGGAVRDLLMNIKPHDIDFATTATPDQMKELFTREKIRMINSNGEAHGTITIRLNDKENYEITTLRIDVVTDGRHAQVEFTKDWKLDANRRDLTINSIFIDSEGNIIDFYNGYEDIKNHRVRFVGEPEVRIQEDYLRILRYFRFYGRIAVDANSHDQPSLKAIKENCEGLSKIAGERLWVEFRKIVTGNFANSLVREIVNTNVHKYIGLPDPCNLNEFDRVFKIFEKDIKELPSSITMVATLLNSHEEFDKLMKRMKFSNEERSMALFIIDHRHLASNTDPNLKAFKNLLVDNIKDAKIKEKMTELLKYIDRLDLVPVLTAWPIPVFPINGAMLMAREVPKGPIFARILDALKEDWKNRYDYRTDEATIQELLDKIDGLKNEVPPKKIKENLPC